MSGKPSCSPPLSLARSLRFLPGFVFLETSLASTQSKSLIAACPERELSGGPEDWILLEKALHDRSHTGCLEDGAAIGFFRYDGSFHFGFYSQVHGYTHGESSDGFLSTSPAETDPSPPFHVHFQPEIEKGAFLEMVARAQAYIAAGDIYQVCLSHLFHSPFSGDFWDYYETLRRKSPAPYSAFLRLGNMQIACASPECFLELHGNQIRTCPIKGTRPRGKNPEADAAIAAELLASSKEQAELIMITDLERNDLGKVCVPGSVKVVDLLRLQHFPQVFHLTSTVEGNLQKGVSPVRAVAACFPGGSVTGAPKKRAMEIIAELETGQRGLYTGAIGYFGYNGQSSFNIVIRTVVEEQGTASFRVGAGIVADSDPEFEWEETLHKAAGLLLAQQAVL